MELKKFQEKPREPIPGVIWDPEAYEKDPEWTKTGLFKPIVEKRNGEYYLVEGLDGVGEEFVTPLKPGYVIIHSNIFGYEAFTPREFEASYIYLREA
jgi:hypothetical protein